MIAKCIYKTFKAGHEANFGMTPSSSFNYGSNDGHPLLSEEESAFIDENIRKLNTSDSATDDNDADEYERQYDEFLKTGLLLYQLLLVLLTRY